MQRRHIPLRHRSGRRGPQLLEFLLDGGGDTSRIKYRYTATANLSVYSTKVDEIRKAMKKIVSYGVPYILYISCNPKTLIRNLPEAMEAGYRIEAPYPGVLVFGLPATAVAAIILWFTADRLEP